MADRDSIACKTCGSQLQGSYCHQCGEKVLRPEDKSAKKWLADLLSNIWMLDGKLFNSLKHLLLKPGKFASDYTEGIRKPYVKPLNLFLMVNLIYFLTSGFDTFKTELNAQINGMPYSPLISDMVESRYGDSQQKTEAYLAYEVRYNKKTGEVSKLIVITLAPLLGLLLYTLFSSRGIYLSDGFNLALQFWAYFVFSVLLVLPLIVALFIRLFGPEALLINGDFEFWLTPLILVLSGFYMYFQLFWLEQKKRVLLGKVAILVVAFLPLLFVYRFILFWLTYWLA
ncbi:MAG: hypothetical protein Roseis2KO_31850 [Roseivirga sp.]